MLVSIANGLQSTSFLDVVTAEPSDNAGAILDIVPLFAVECKQMIQRPFCAIRTSLAKSACPPVDNTICRRLFPNWIAAENRSFGIQPEQVDEVILGNCIP